MPVKYHASYGQKMLKEKFHTEIGQGRTEENGKNTLKDRIKMILENEFSYLTSPDSGVTMATNDKRSSAEKEDNYADE